eukprot:1475115-Pleurochrysis_carterae.AAC.1
MPASLRLAGTGFTEITAAHNNPSPLHIDTNNFGMTVVCANNVSRGTSLKYGSHVFFDAGQKFAIIVKDHSGGV